MKTHHVAFVTCQKVQGFESDDAAALPALEAVGITAEALPWNSPSMDWKKFDALIVRATWDYWLHYPEFLRWLDTMESAGITIYNSPMTLRENTNKTYLQRMEKAGVPILPTVWIRKQSPQILRETLVAKSWKEAVLKPAISGGAFRTYRFKTENADAHETHLQEILSNGSVAMVQPLIDTILKEGEISFLFFDGKFSHSAVKRGSEGEFRIQRTYGGTVEPFSPTPTELSQAKFAYESYCGNEHRLLYARLDFVRDPNDEHKLLLMEFEATEPCLFFLNDQAQPGAAQRFANALRERISKL